MVKLAAIKRELFLSSLSFTTLSKLRTVRCYYRTATWLSEEQNSPLLLQDHTALGGAEQSAAAAGQNGSARGRRLLISFRNSRI